MKGVRWTGKPGLPLSDHIDKQRTGQEEATPKPSSMQQDYVFPILLPGPLLPVSFYLYL